MKKPEIPPDEKERLATLHAMRILDTAPEERFDRLTRLAQRLFDVPVAIVSLVDAERQWFKSRQGIGIAETPRDISFCGHAILEDEVFTVPDALADPRFCDNPLVLEDPKIRFYAGCPVAALDGKKMGTLCVIDRKPRQLSEAELRLLQDLGKIVEAELGRRTSELEDQLTGETSRQGFVTLLRYVLEFSREMNYPIALLVVCLRKLPQLNQLYGHGTGDRAILEVARLLGRTVRRSDISGRLGADEFYVFLPKCTSNYASLVKARLGNELRSLNAERKFPCDLELSSAAVEWLPGGSESVEDLVFHAETVMREVKGKNL